MAEVRHGRLSGCVVRHEPADGLPHPARGLPAGRRMGAAPAAAACRCARRGICGARRGMAAARRAAFAAACRYRYVRAGLLGPARIDPGVCALSGGGVGVCRAGRCAGPRGRADAAVWRGLLFRCAAAGAVACRRGGICGQRRAAARRRAARPDRTRGGANDRTLRHSGAHAVRAARYRQRADRTRHRPDGACT